MLNVSSTNRRGVSTLFLAMLSSCSPNTPQEDTAHSWGPVTVVEEMRVGVGAGDPDYMFSSINGLAVSRDGLIVVTETQEVRRPDGSDVLIRAYGPEGGFLYDVGRVGQGPGEYQTPRVAFASDGRMMVWDMPSGRVLFFSMGSYETSVAASGRSATVVVDDAGNFYLERSSREDGRPRLFLQRYSLSGEQLGEVPLPTPVATVENPGEADFVLGPEGSLRPFTRMTMHAWSPLGYVVVGDNAVYDIELRKPRASTHLRRSIDAAPVLPEEMAEWNRFRDRAIRRNNERGIHYPIVSIPAVKPFFRAIYVGDDGRVWVHRYVTAEHRTEVAAVDGQADRPLLTWREPPTFDVFDPSSSFLGSVRLPDGFRPYVFRDQWIWGISTDESGLEQVVRLRIDAEQEPSGREQ